MFAYCGNNPVKNNDSAGHVWAGICEWIENAYYDTRDALRSAGETVKAGGKYIVDHTVKPLVLSARDYLSKANGTVSLGFFGAGSPTGVSGSYQIGLAFDLKGNIAVQGTPAVGFSNGTPCWSAGLYGSISDAPTINDMAGSGYQTGGSFNAISPSGLGVVLGGESNVLIASGAEYYGATGSMGLTGGAPWSFGMEGHIETGYTTNYLTFNIYDGMAAFYHWCFD